MHTKLAGHLPLQDLIANVISGARAKVAAAEEPKEEKKDEKVKKLLKYEKKEHGHIPSVKEEQEKKASVIDSSDPDEVEKLASALETVAAQLEKEAGDSIENGGESKQGGEQLPTMNAVPGKQPYKKDGSKKHSVPMSTGMQTGEAGGASTQVPNDHARAPGGGAKQGQIKQSAAQGVLAKIQAAVQPAEKTASAAPAGNTPVDFILGKLAGVENGGESKQGGEQLSNTAPVPSNPGREMISSNASVVSATKAKAKAPQKKLLSQVLTEPAQSKSTDSKVHENLRNATKGGVKIAAAKALLQKIAEEGCQCSGKGECKYCKMKAAKAKMQEGSSEKK